MAGKLGREVKTWRTINLAVSSRYFKNPFLFTTLTWGWVESQHYTAGAHSNNCKRSSFSHWNKRGFCKLESVNVWDGEFPAPFLFFLCWPALKPVQVIKLYKGGGKLKSLRENWLQSPKKLEKGARVAWRVLGLGKAASLLLFSPLIPSIEEGSGGCNCATLKRGGRGVVGTGTGIPLGAAMVRHLISTLS